MPPTKLLLVDDNEDFLKILGERLTRRGYAVTAVSDGPQALRAVEEEGFHLVILDVVMSDMDGLEVLARLRQRAPRLPVIMLTGYSTAGQALELGAAEVLIKPTDLETLIERIESVKRPPEQA